MASTMLGDSNGTSVGSLYTRVMVDLRDPRYDKTWQRDKDIQKCLQDESVADADDIYDGSLQKNLAVR